MHEGTTMPTSSATQHNCCSYNSMIAKNKFLKIQLSGESPKQISYLFWNGHLLCPDMKDTSEF